MTRRLRTDLRPIDRDPAQLSQARRPRRAHRLAEHLREVLPVADPEPVDRAEVRRQAPGQVPEPQVPAKPPRDLTAAVDALGRPEQPQLQQHPWRIRSLARRRIAFLEGLQFQTLDKVVDEEGRVVCIQRFAQMRRKQLTLVLFVPFEVDFTTHDRHTYQMTSLGSGS